MREGEDNKFLLRCLFLIFLIALIGSIFIPCLHKKLEEGKKVEQGNEVVIPEN
jgi:hypothetical protein